MMPSGVQVGSWIADNDIVWLDIFFCFTVEKERKIAVVQPEKQWVHDSDDYE